MAEQPTQFIPPHTKILVALDEQKVQTDKILAELDAIEDINSKGLTSEQYDALKTDVKEFNKVLTDTVNATNTLPGRYDAPLERYNINNPSHPSLEERLNGVVSDDTLASYTKSTDDLIQPSTTSLIVTAYLDQTLIEEEVDDMAEAEKDQARMEADWELSESNAEKMKTLYDGYIEGIDEQSKITPNWTTAVDSPTYHITLYMVNEIVFNDPSLHLKNDSPAFGALVNDQVTGYESMLNEQNTGIADDEIIAGHIIPPRAIIVAESGVTSSFSIDNLVIEDIQAAPSNKGSTFSTESSFDVAEPGGFSFVHKIMAMSRILGFSNFNDAKFIIQVDFMALDPITGNNISYPSTMTSDKKPARSIYYPVWATNIRSTTDAKGSNYHFTCAHNNTIAAYRRINSALTMKNVVTVGDLLDGLQSELNAYERRTANTGDDDIIADKWAIRFNINPKDKQSLPSEQESIANMLDAEFLKFPLVEATLDKLKTESDPVKSASMSKKQDPNIVTKDEKIEQESSPCGQTATGTGIDGNNTATTQQVDAESKTIEADGNHYELLKNKDPITWVRTQLSKVPLFYKIAIKIQTEFQEYAAKINKGSEANVPKHNLIPKIVIDSATYTSDKEHSRTGLHAKTTILNIKIVWEAIPDIDIADPKFQKTNLKLKNILKRYNYMFSGENTEVTNFDLSHNNLFHAIKYIDAIETDIPKINNEIIKTDRIPKYISDLQVNDFGSFTNIDMKPTYVTEEMPNQSSINNSGESTEDNKDAQLAAKMLEEQNRMTDNMNIDLHIVGDPDWMLGRDTIISDKGHPIISKFMAEGDGLSSPISPREHHNLYYEKLGRGDLGAGVDVGEEYNVGVASIAGITGQHDPIGLYLHAPVLPCISFINFLPSNSIFEAWDGDKSSFDMDTMTSGVYKINTIQHKLTRGSFTQRLSGVREIDIKTSFVKSELRGIRENK